METAGIILVLGFIYFMSHLFTWVFQRSKFPDVLLLIAVGFLIGPILGQVNPSDFGRVGEVMTTIALTVILFESGTSLNIKSLGDAAGATLSIGIVTFLITVGIVTGIGFLAGLDTLSSLLLGSILGGTSSAVVIPLVSSLGVSEKPKTIMVLESALTDVLCIILSFAFLEASLSGRMDPKTIATSIGLSLGVAAIIGFAAGVIWLQLWNFVHRWPNSTFTTIAFAFVVYGFTDSIGYSGAIAALTLGLTLANGIRLKKIESLQSPLSDVERKFYGEIVFILKTFFFIYLGISIKLNSSLMFFLAFVAVVLIFAARLGIVRVLLSKNTSRRDASVMSFMVPKGLAAAVLAGLPVQKGLVGGDKIQSLTYAAVLMSIFFTAVMIPALRNPTIKKFYDGFLGRFPEAPLGAPNGHLLEKNPE